MFKKSHLPAEKEHIQRPTLTDILFLSRFARNEDGAFTVFGLFVVLMMLLAGGVALDVMRSEVERTKVQNVIDRAVLSAADQDQNVTAEEVVAAYLRAADLPPDAVTVDTVPLSASGEKSVTISGKARTANIFLDNLGYDTLEVPVSSQAKESIVDLEVSLVLDISGSMGGDKIASLRTAAQEFVAKLLNGREDKTTISIVPYNDRVNVGSTLANYFPLSGEHTFSNCVVFDNDDFLARDLPDNTTLERMGHFDRDSGSTNNPGLVADPLCRTDNYGSILAWSNDVGELQAHIRSLSASDWTAMDLGVKWGTLLLDPSTRPQMQAMLAAGDLKTAENITTERFTGRPYDYDQGGNRKVMVVMTDGRNTTQWDLKSNYKNGPSGVFAYNPGLVPPGLDDDLASEANGCAPGTGPGGCNPNLANSNGNGLANGRSFYSPDYNQMGELLAAYSSTPGALELTSASGERVTFDDAWWSHGSRGGWIRHDTNLADTDGDGNSDTRYSIWSDQFDKFYIPHLRTYQDQPFGGTDAVELALPELYAAFSTRYLANVMMRFMDFNSRVKYFYAWEETHNQSSANSNLANICAAARDNRDITIYTIAFQAPEDGKTAMENCVGEDSLGFFTNVETLDIDQAFEDILASINRLRLTQ